jgi:hypothetical protein
VKNIHPLKTELRISKRIQKLGAEHAICLWCGCADPMLLRPITRSFLQQHHPFGKDSDRDTTGALCFNCHALATEGLMQLGVTMSRDPNPRKFAINVFQAYGFHLKMLGEAAERFAQLLVKEEGNFGANDPIQYKGTMDVIGYILLKAWPIWKAHQGKVPDNVLRQLEIDNKWPRGCATAAMERIDNDKDLQGDLERWSTNNEATKIHDSKVADQGHISPESRSSTNLETPGSEHVRRKEVA